MIKIVTIALALIGLAVGAWAVVKSSITPPSHEPINIPSINPYPAGIAATGIIETASRDLRITAPSAGLVTDVFVQVNDQIIKGQKLFRLDPRSIEAQRVIAEAAVEAARAQLDRLMAQPRPQDLVPLQAAVRLTEVQLDTAEDSLARTETAHKDDAATEAELARRRFAVQGAQATLDEAKAQLQRLAAGAWEADINIAKANLGQAKASMQALAIQMERLTVRSPIDGVVLKRNIEPGEFTGSLPGTGALLGAGGGAAAMIIGDLSQLRVRAQIDELDITLVRLGAPAVARLRGLERQELKLKMIRIEPLALPKQQLAGTNIELVDTRVVEVLFDIDATPEVPVYPGQLVDVFIEVQQRH